MLYTAIQMLYKAIQKSASFKFCYEWKFTQFIFLQNNKDSFLQGTKDLQAVIKISSHYQTLML